MRRIWKWLGGIGRRKLAQEILMRIPQLTREQLLDGFAVDSENKLLTSVVHMLRGQEEIAVENVRDAKQGPYERAYYAGAISALAEAQERIADLVMQGNLRKRGETNATD